MRLPREHQEGEPAQRQDDGRAAPDHAVLQVSRLPKSSLTARIAASSAPRITNRHGKAPITLAARCTAGSLVSTGSGMNALLPRRLSQKARSSALGLSGTTRKRIPPRT